MIRIRGPRVLAANRTFSSLGNGFELKIVALTSVEFNISGILDSLNTFRYQFTSIEAAHKYPHYAIISKVFEFLITYLNHMLFFLIIFHFVSFLYLQMFVENSRKHQPNVQFMIDTNENVALLEMHGFPILAVNQFGLHFLKIIIRS